MIRTVIAAVAIFASLPATADEARKPAFNVRQCLEVLAGLNSLNFVGQQSPQQQPPAGAQQYKLGPLRMTIALDIHRLQEVSKEAGDEQTDFTNGLPAPNGDSAAAAARQGKIDENWKKVIAADCPVEVGRLAASKLKLGDGPDENQIPPSVLSVLTPIIDVDQ